MEKTYAGFVALIGRPSVGKSTLLNCLMKQKLAITSYKPQTTRNQIRAVLTEEQRQLILLDTPGLHTPSTALHERIVGYAKKAALSADLVCWLITPIRVDSPIPMGDQHILESLKNKFTQIPLFLLINKIDQATDEELLYTAKVYSELYAAQEIFFISALKSKGTDKVKKYMQEALPENEFLFPEDRYTDVSENKLIGELIREQVIRCTHKEIPYGAAVMIDQMKEVNQGRKLEVYATIFLSKDSHKAIVIGAKGSMLKEIGTAARKSIARVVGMPVYLGLHVKIKRDWVNRGGALEEFGYTRQG